MLTTRLLTDAAGVSKEQQTLTVKFVKFPKEIQQRF